MKNNYPKYFQISLIVEEILKTYQKYFNNKHIATYATEIHHLIDPDMVGYILSEDTDKNSDWFETLFQVNEMKIIQTVRESGNEICIYNADAKFIEILHETLMVIERDNIQDEVERKQFVDDLLRSGELFKLPEIKAETGSIILRHNGSSLLAVVERKDWSKLQFAMIENEKFKQSLFGIDLYNRICEIANTPSEFITMVVINTFEKPEDHNQYNFAVNSKGLTAFGISFSKDHQSKFNEIIKTDRKMSIAKLIYDKDFMITDVRIEIMLNVEQLTF